MTDSRQQTFGDTAEGRLLAAGLVLTQAHDKAKRYDKRNEQVMQCLHYARRIGLECGIRFDPDEPEWPVVYIELPTGQVSWHVPQHVKPWDKHTTQEKYDRVMRFHAEVHSLYV